MSGLNHRFAIVSSAALLCLAALGCNAGGDESQQIGSSQDALITAPTLGSAANFAVLADAAVTCTDGSILGSVGTLQSTPLGAITQTNCPISGTIAVGTVASATAYSDFLAAYDQLDTQRCDRVLSGTLANVILTPGVYCFPAAAALTGTLTLSGPANGTWLFKVGSAGTGALTATNFSMVMANGASACNVTWLVAEAATMTDSNFKGTVLAGMAETVTRGTFEGRAFAKSDVTLTGAVLTGCVGGSIGGGGNGGGHGNGNGDHGNGNGGCDDHCNQGHGNGSEGCDPGNSNHHNGSNDEGGGRGRGGRDGRGH